MKGVVINDMLLVEGRTQVDDLNNDSVGNYQPFRREEFGSLLQFVDLEFPPQSLVLVNSFIGEIT